MAVRRLWLQRTGSGLAGFRGRGRGRSTQAGCSAEDCTSWAGDGAAAPAPAGRLLTAGPPGKPEPPSPRDTRCPAGGDVYKDVFFSVLLAADAFLNVL